MQRINLQRYFFLGTALRYLQDCEQGYRIKKLNDSLCILDNIRIFLRDITELKLYVTKRAAHGLERFYENLKKDESKESLTLEDSEKLKKIMNELRPTFDAESEGIFAFYATDKKYSIDNLIGGMDKLFRPGIFNLLSDFAKTDFIECGYCIAFERPTAAAFHILRGTEEVLRVYYKKFIRGKKKGFKTWGQMTFDLKNKNSGKKPNAIIVNHLINIKDSFRNPTQHPDKIYDIYEVQDLLSLCIDVINRMAHDMK